MYPLVRQANVLVGLLSGLLLLPAAGTEIRFSRDVLPLLSDRCFHCHGPDEGHREAGLRLDRESDAKAPRDGSPAIVPGDPDASALWHRINTPDTSERMPPPEAHRQPLTSAERETLREWIAQGAPWGKHWAFETLRRPPVPPGPDHPVDAFIHRRLQEHGLTPSPPAEPHTLLRRLHLDLLGLPPSPDEVERFCQDPSETAWLEAVEATLASPHHGERLAMWWLDAARYADTDGYQGDAERTNWPWRDWVVQAFNANMPFDQFTLEQMAGDLLTDPTKDQILATAFHRHHMTNGEGGRDPEESRIDYVIDRTNTTGTLWLGLTMGCAQCHSHKFDPISHEDYYRFFAFFNNIDEDGRAGSNAKPYLTFHSPLAERAVKEMDAYVELWTAREALAREEARRRFEEWLTQTLKTLPGEFRAWRPLSPEKITSAEGTDFTVEDDGVVQTHGSYPNQDDYRLQAHPPSAMKRITGWKLEILPHPSHTDGRWSRGREGDFILTNVKMLVRRQGESQVRDLEMDLAVANSEKGAQGRNYGNVRDTLDDDPRNGWTTSDDDPASPPTAVFALAEPLALHGDEQLIVVLLQRSTDGDANIGRFRISVTDQSGETVRSLEEAPLETLARSGTASATQLEPQLKDRLFSQFLVDDPAYQKIERHVAEARQQHNELRRQAEKQEVMVLAERAEPRTTHILERGVWDAMGPAVIPGMPEAILPGPSLGANRLDLARWLTSPDNPLTARVIANHLWQLVFGAGLVRTPGDFGLQGSHPTHPDLLDWLAVELIDHDWDLRHLLRLLVTNQTYRQQSHLRNPLPELDPENLWWARAHRFRLPAWMIRDQALAVSGLLNPALGGPPVRPWQPEGVWEEIFMGRFTYRPSVGPAQHRRTLYAFWRRSSAPTFLFDHAQRRVCEVDLRRTNTPLQALTLLNDRTLGDAAQTLATEALRAAADDAQTSPSPGVLLDSLARRLLARPLTGREQDILTSEFDQALSHYQTHPEDARHYLSQGPPRLRPPSLTPHHAALTLLASLMLNLDETITRE